MKFSVTIGNTKKTRRAIAAYAQRIGQATEDAVEDLGIATAEQAKQLIMTSPASGNIYFRENPTRIHQASAPGEPPANDLGNLVRSIVVKQIKINQYAYASVVGSALHYALDLEKGNLATNLAPRPFLRPAVTMVEARAQAIIAGAWDKNNL